MFRPGRVLALVAVLLLIGAVALQLIPTDSPAPPPASSNPQPATPPETTTSNGGLVDEKVMQQVSAIEAKHRQWDSTVWADELAARDHGESIIQLWDNLLAGADAFDMLSKMPVEAVQLGQAQPVQEWESGIRRTGFAKGGPSWTQEQFAQTLGQWKADGWSLKQSEWRHRRFNPSAEGGARSVFWISLHVVNTRLAKRGILRGDVEVQWQPSEITPETLASPKGIDLSSLE